MSRREHGVGSISGGSHRGGEWSRGLLGFSSRSRALQRPGNSVQQWEGEWHEQGDGREISAEGSFKANKYIFFFLKKDPKQG